MASSSGSRTLRRLISVVCAVAFLFVSLVHTAQHSAVDHFGSAGLELSDTINGAAGDQSHDKAADGSAHCHGCMLAAIVELGLTDVAAPMHSFINFVPPTFSAVTLSTDVPYPIVTI